MTNILSELKNRFFGERPPTDPDREAERIDKDRTREVFARAESFARMGPPIDASLNPVTSPENVQMRVTSGLADLDGGGPSDMSRRGTASGLEAGAKALCTECGWSAREAEALKREVERGQMTEGQFMRVVEEELQQSATSGRFRNVSTRDPLDGAPDSENRKNPFGAVEDLARGGER
jgi:hypothetical protein